MTDEQNGGLDKEQRREFARLATDEATLLGQGQQEFWGIEPLVELLQHGAEVSLLAAQRRSWVWRGNVRVWVWHERHSEDKKQKSLQGDSLCFRNFQPLILTPMRTAGQRR